MTISENTKFIAKTFAGLEKVLAKEIEDIGGENIEILNRAVSFTGDKAMLYKANIFLRSALRILLPLKTTHVQSEQDVYQAAKRIKWEDIFTVSHTIVVNAVAHSKYIEHSYYTALKFKDGIVDRFREKYQKRPSVDKDDPDYKINVHISDTTCTVSLDSSSESLHKRGYKERNVVAPINEVLAAGLILLSGWDKESTFIDPMCGSGTLPIEACLYANDIPPGIFRSTFGFKRWHGFDKNLFGEISEHVNMHPYKSTKIIGSDISERAIETSQANCENAEIEQSVDLFVKDFKEYNSTDYEPGTVIMNPPYDIKLKEDNIHRLYKEIGDTLKQCFDGFDVWLFSANLRAIKSIGLRASEKIPLYNAALESRFVNYKIYKGSKKEKKN